jgi:hypothetical protein
LQHKDLDESTKAAKKPLAAGSGCGGWDRGTLVDSEARFYHVDGKKARNFNVVAPGRVFARIADDPFGRCRSMVFNKGIQLGMPGLRLEGAGVSRLAEQQVGFVEIEGTARSKDLVHGQPPATGNIGGIK